MTGRARVAQPEGIGAGMTRTSCYRVAAIKPFWRWAVAPESGHSAGIPYYRKASALAFLDEVRRELPWDQAVLLRKRFFRRVEVMAA